MPLEGSLSPKAAAGFREVFLKPLRAASRYPRVVLAAIALVPLVLIAGVDALTPASMELWILGLPWVCVVSWILGRRYGLAVCVAAAAIWTAAMKWTGAPLPPAGTMLLRLAAVAGFALAAAQLRRRLEESSRTDPLTGLGNEQAFLESLGAEISRQRRYERPLGVIYTDLDDFRDFCSRLGEFEGEHVIRRMALTSRRHLRESDVVTLRRPRGDELIVLLPETNATGVDAAANRLLRILKEDLRAVDGALGVTMCRVALTDSAKAPEEILRDLEKEMRRRKAAERSRKETAASQPQ